MYSDLVLRMDGGGYGFGHSFSSIPNWNAIVGTIKDNEDSIESRRLGQSF